MMWRPPVAVTLLQQRRHEQIQQWIRNWFVWHDSPEGQAEMAATMFELIDVARHRHGRET